MNNEYANSKPVEAVTVADIGAEKRVDDSAVWCRFGSWSLVIKLSFCSDLSDLFSTRFGQDFVVEVQARLKFGQYFAADAWSRL